MMGEKEETQTVMEEKERNTDRDGGKGETQTVGGKKENTDRDGEKREKHRP